MEQHVVASTPELGGALVVGARQSQNVLLIEPAVVVTGEARRGPPLSSTTAEQAALIERVWPSVREANATAAAHQRVVDKALILVTAPDRPLVRDSRGVVQRAASAEQYAGEIETLCANADLGPEGVGGPRDAPEPLVSPDPGSIGQFVQESVSAVTSWPHEDAERRPSATFFERGMDSPTALQLAHVLRRGLRRPDIGLSTVYCNPTVSQLASAILAATGDGPEGDDRATIE
ncbi:putative nrps-like enzyme [Diaporthe ampelina]|uniref:Putative nrps-like enzyme n=1 Tax=Diaporthe ampelina TaxID=1214573 RepID=A0A0G2FYP8_9PEZI|nr:putative nrps-like enzyme [Diaporthe ampelina]